MQALASALLLVVAVIHLLPVAGVLGADRLGALYGITVAKPELELLMRHRAVLFGLLGVFIGVAAFVRAWQIPAVVAGAVSVVSFLVLTTEVDSVNAAIHRVVVADLVALAALIGASALLIIAHRSPS